MGTEEQNVLYAFRNEKEKEQQLRDLIERYWDDWTDYWNKKSKCKDTPDTDPYVVYPAIPIIWFGDINKYWTSPIKIVTVAINPSNHEFSENGKAPYSIECRFKEASSDSLSKNSSIEFRFENADSKLLNKDNLIRAYNNYFKLDIGNNPYSDYFLKFERALQNLPIKASYGYHQSDNTCTAIHIDFDTAIATKFIWGEKKREKFKDGSSLEEFKEVKNFLSKKRGVNEGETQKRKRRKKECKFNELFETFLGILDPDVLLVSSSSVRDVLVNKVKYAENKEENRRISFESFNVTKNPGRTEDEKLRVSYKLDGRLWLYGRNDQKLKVFFLPTGSRDEEKAEYKFFEKSFRLSKIKKLQEIMKHGN